MRTIRWLLLGFLAAWGVARAEEDAGSDPTAEITAEELTAHVRYLAGDELEGRRSGTDGGEKAAAYIAEQFKAVGLTPAGDEGTYLSWFSLPGKVPLPDQCRLRTLSAAGVATVFEVGKGWDPFSFSSNASLKAAETAFLGYGISSPGLGWDDYAGVDVKGKVVVVLRRGPLGKGFRGRGRMHMTFQQKALVAQKNGAAGVVLVDDRLHHPESADRCPTRIPVRGKAPAIPFLFAKRAVTDALFPDLARLEREMDTTGAPVSRVLPGAKIDISLTLGQVRTANVVGLLPGSDPELAGEFVVVGAHYDHLGTDGGGALDPGAKDRLWNGADDNASGTAGLIELAERLALAVGKPKRTIVFVAFAAEELGLLGSGHYLRNPAAPLARTSAMLNLDMIGRSRADSLFVGGTGTAKEFSGILDRAQKGIGLSLRRSASGASPSDNRHFDRKKIPTLFFFTGMHRDYHRTTDDWDKLNYGAMDKILDLISVVLVEVANIDTRPAFVAVPRPQRSGTYLGITLDRTDTGPGALVESVMQATPAARGGMLDGDRIVVFGGDPVKTVQDLIVAIRKRKAGDKVKVVVERGGDRVPLEVQLGGR